MLEQGWDNKLKPMGEPLDVVRTLANLAIGVLGGSFEDFFNMFGQPPIIQDMQDSTQKFEGIQVYGARYMPSNMTPTSNLTRAPFTGNIHEGVGVTYSGSEIILNSRGLFKADAQSFFSWITLGGSGCYMDIVVRRPNGTEFSRKPAIQRATNTVTVFNSHTFGVPEAGYRLSVELAADPSVVGTDTRAILGGKGYTSLVVNKWSNEPE